MRRLCARVPRTQAPRAQGGRTPRCRQDMKIDGGDHYEKSAMEVGIGGNGVGRPRGGTGRSEEHTSELQSLMRISYAVFCLKKTNKNKVSIKQQRRKQRDEKT